jgi:anti-anti-sigma factor
LSSQPLELTDRAATVPASDYDDDRFIVEASSSPGLPPRMRLHLRGALDVAAAVALANQITSALIDGCDVVLDCENVTFIDASGLATILAAHRQGIRAGHGVVAQKVPPHIERFFDLARLGFLLKPSEPTWN